VSLVAVERGVAVLRGCTWPLQLGNELDIAGLPAFVGVMSVRDCPRMTAGTRGIGHVAGTTETTWSGTSPRGASRTPRAMTARGHHDLWLAGDCGQGLRPVPSGRPVKIDPPLGAGSPTNPRRGRSGKAFGRW
jgi:hypothetical protein